jgi:regulator of sigma E protease
MSFLGFTWYYIVVFLFVLTVLVYVHEWGHYWVAKRNGVRIETFSIGFGPEIFGWNDAVGTRWKIGLIPLGGYVKMFGENMEDEETGETVELTPEEQAVSFHHKTLAQRAAIVFAGPAVNYLFAIAVFAALAVFQGTATPLAVVGEVMPDSAAAEAGLMQNDKIVAIDGAEISLFSELREKVMANPGRSLRFDVVRDGNAVALNAVPKSAERADEDGVAKTIGLLGVRPNLEHVAYERHNPAMALWVGVQQTATMTVNILVYVRDMIMGTRATDDLGGPLRIAQISGDMAKGGIAQLVLLMAMLSVNLGLINLFPIPMLDGGHLAFYAAEAIRGKPLDPKVQEYGFRFGLILVLLLVVFVTWNDLVHLRVFEFIKDLFT